MCTCCNEARSAPESYRMFADYCLHCAARRIQYIQRRLPLSLDDKRNRCRKALADAMHLLTREFSHSLGYSAQERAVQLRFLRRVLEGVRTGDAEAARQAMARLVAGSASYLAQRSPELVAQKVRWGQI